MKRSPSSPFAVGSGLFAALFVMPLFGLNEYYVFTLNIMMIYVILTVGLNLLMGFAGQLSFASGALFGIGAYGVGLLQRHFGVPFWLGMPAGGVVAAVIGLVLVFPALRLTGIYLAIATLAFAQCALWVMVHWTSVTFGASGFTLKGADFSSLSISSETGMYYLSWLCCVLLVLAARNIVHSRLGRAFVAMRDHQISAQALGIDPLRYKVLAFAISSFYAGIAGSLFAGTLRFVGPESFDLHQMILLLVAVVLGGTGSIAGSVIGGVMIVVILEITKDLKVSVEIVFGAMLLFFVLFARGGVIEFIRSWLPNWSERLHGAQSPSEKPRRAGTPVLETTS
jgi:branched-chain amino acid transport system permease protein